MAATLLFLTVQTTNGHRNPDLIKGWPLWVRETYPPTEVGKWSLPDLNPQKLLMLRPSMPQGSPASWDLSEEEGRRLSWIFHKL